MARLEVRVKGKVGREGCNWETNRKREFRTVARTILEIFLSSTAADLKSHREAVHSRLARIEFFKVIRQEDFAAQNAGAVDYCSEKARTADLFIGLIGMRRGWEPHGDNATPSINEVEYDCGKE